MLTPQEMAKLQRSVNRLVADMDAYDNHPLKIREHAKLERKPPQEFPDQVQNITEKNRNEPFGHTVF